MAAAVEPKDAASKHDSQVDEQIAEATSRIRTHDLAFGGLTVAALVLVYATAMIVLDRSLDLPEWVRQFSLAGFAGVLGAAAYCTLVSPLRKRINPLYAARQVERTIDDPKNSVTGYVDAREKDDLNPTVKAALASKAAKVAAEADVNRAVDHRSLIYLGGVAVAFLLALVVLFFVFRPTQFGSLMGRAFVPFKSDPIKTQTELTLVKPDPADTTVTTGQSVTVGVHVGGKVPKADGPDKVRLLVRHNQADPNYDELPMVQGETSRDWELRVPDYLVQNGFWYKVAAGDAVTEEHRVDVRSLPMFSSFHATYEYPKYLRRKSDSSDDPVIKGYRGTTVTLVARTNRPVRDGLMVLEPSNARVAGAPDQADPTALRFVFKLTEGGKYKLSFNATSGERTLDPFQGVTIVESDLRPIVTINKPEEDVTDEPTNGIVKIDGKVGDDFGVDTVTLKMKVVSPVEIPLPDKPYLNGKSPSFRREKDDTWPTDVEYKDSIDLARLTKAVADVPLKLEPGMVIEYWLEAADNCTEPRPNVGVSKSKKVRLLAPKVEEPEKKALDKQKEVRKNEEKKHNDDQQKKLENEKRDQKNDARPGDKTENKTGEKGDATPDAKKNDTDNAPKKDDPNNPPKTDGMPGAGMNDPMPKNDQKGDEQPNAKVGEQGDAKPDAKGGNSDSKVDETARELENELNKERQNGGSAKPNNATRDDERTAPAESKPQPKDGTAGMNGAAETKPEPKQPGPNDPMPKDDPNGGPSTSKPQGDLKPNDPATQKPEPKQPDGMNDAAPSEERGEPFGAPPGGDKPPQKGKEPQPKDPNGKQDPNAKQDPNSGSGAKPSTQKKDDNAPGMPNAGDKKSDPAADAGSQSKPMREPTRGEDKPQPKGPTQANPTAPQQSNAKSNGEPDAGDAKPQAAPPAGGAKPQPKEGPMPMGKDADPKPSAGANDPMQPNAANASEARPEDAKKNPPTGGKPVEKGTDKPAPQDNKGNASAGDAAPMPKEKIDAKQRQELKQAANDLASPDQQKKQDARDKLDKAVGQEKRQELEQAANDTKSDDMNKRGAGQKKLEDFKDRLDGKEPDKTEGNPGAAPTPKEKIDEKQRQELKQAASDLANPDPQKKKDAQDKLDKSVGQEKRQELEQAANDAKSDDTTKRDAGQKKLDDFKDRLDGKNDGKEPEKTDDKGPDRKGADGKATDKKDGKGGAPKFDQKQQQELENAAKDLTDKDPKKQQAARDKLDKAVGQEKRQELEQTQKDLNSDDKEKQKAAREKIEQWKKEAADHAKKEGREPTPEELAAEKQQNKETEEALKDLRGNDPAKKEAARQKLDKTVGRDTRERAEDLFNDLDSSDPDKQKRGEQKLQDWRKESDLKNLENKAQDLNSPDPKTREQAEKDLDAKIGEENRKKLQEEMKNKKPETSKERDQFKKQLEQWREGLGSGTPNKGPMEDDPKNRLKSAELMLEQFENEENRKLLKGKKGWTDTEYDEFLKGYRKRVEDMRNDVNREKPITKGPEEKTNPTIKAGGGGKVESNGTGGPGAGVGGPAVAPPGFEDARRRFEEALKKKP